MRSSRALLLLVLLVLTIIVITLHLIHTTCTMESRRYMHWRSIPKPFGPCPGQMYAASHLTTSHLISSHSNCICNVIILLITFIQNGSINLWTVRHDQGHCAHTFQPPTGAASKSPQIGVLRVMPGERSFLSGSWDSAVSLWDLDDGRLIRQFNGPHNAPITSIEVSFAASQQLIMTASLDGVLALWDGRVGGGAAAAHIIPPGQSPPWCLSACLSPDGQSVYCGRRDGHIERFDLRNLPAASAAPAQILKAPPNAGPVTAVYCVPGGDGLLVSANTDCLRLWSTRLAGAESSSSSSSSSCRVIRGHPGGGPVSAIHVDPQRLFMVTSSGSRGLSATTTAAATTATATTADSSQLMFYSITA